MSLLWDNSGDLFVSMVLAHTFSGIDQVLPIIPGVVSGQDFIIERMLYHLLFWVFQKQFLNSRAKETVLQPTSEYLGKTVCRLQPLLAAALSRQAAIPCRIYVEAIS